MPLPKLSVSEGIKTISKHALLSVSLR